MQENESPPNTAVGSPTYIDEVDATSGALLQSVPVRSGDSGKLMSATSL
jgi:hypothetical protein